MCGGCNRDCVNKCAEERNEVISALSSDLHADVLTHDQYNRQWCGAYHTYVECASPHLVGCDYYDILGVQHVLYYADDDCNVTLAIPDVIDVGMSGCGREESVDGNDRNNAGGGDGKKAAGGGKKTKGRGKKADSGVAEANSTEGRHNGKDGDMTDGSGAISTPPAIGGVLVVVVSSVVVSVVRA